MASGRTWTDSIISSVGVGVAGRRFTKGALQERLRVIRSKIAGRIALRDFNISLRSRRDGRLID
jgi:hypothetical protein